MTPFRMLLLVGLLWSIAACDGMHDHDHESGGHSHGDDTHAHDHHDAGGSGDDHGHGGGVVITHFSDATELFVEFPPLAVGRASEFAAHLTRLDSFEPIADGELIVRLAGGGTPEEVFTARPSEIPGIFRPVAIPSHAGAGRRLTFELYTDDVVAFHDVGTHEVFATAAAADASLPEEDDDPGLIPFLKEQQWRVDFATAEVEERVLSASVAAPAILTPAPGGDATLSAPADGILLGEGQRFPDIGDAVERGQILARLVPRLGGEQDYAGILAAAEAAQAALDAARADRGRVERLLADGAVSERRLEEARAAERTARAQLEAANARLTPISGDAGGAAGVAIRSPVAGRIAHLAVGVGAYVNSGAPLFRIVDASTLRLHADVAEIDAVGLGLPTSAWFRAAGSDHLFDTAAADGRLVAAGAAVDPVKRTVPVVFEFTNPANAFRAGMSVQAHVRTGPTMSLPAVPAAAVVDDAGQPVVFVMADGEHWERRVVRIAVRDADVVGITDGVEFGERVVSRGAYLVHLAAGGTAEIGHGHAH